MNASVNVQDLKTTFRKRTTNHHKSPAPEKLTARSVVKLCRSRITWCRNRQYSWDEIAEMLCQSAEESTGKKISLSGRTTRRYYYELKKSAGKGKRCGGKR